MTLEETLVKIQQACHNNPPNNETATRERVFNRLLRAIGYEEEDWLTETKDEAGKRPDYILLHGTEFEWYLEAKAWQVELTPKDAGQAISYPNHKGKRWAILSNGRVWKLYDNYRQASIEGKLVISVSLDDIEGIVRLLKALAQESVKSGGLELFEKHETERLAELDKAHKVQQRQELLAKTILQQIRTEGSPLVLAMVNSLHEEAGLESITPKDVVLFFQSEEKEMPLEKRSHIPPNPKTTERIVTGKSFTQIVKFPIDGKSERPYLLIAPDGKEFNINSWADMAEKSVIWIWKQIGNLPLPFRSVQKFRYFLNTNAKRRDGEPMRKSRTISLNGNMIWMDPDWTASDFIKMLIDLSRECKIDPSGFYIRLNGREG